MNKKTIIKKLKTSNLLELSKRSGVSRTTLYKIIAGGDVRLYVLEKLKEALKDDKYNR